MAESHHNDVDGLVQERRKSSVLAMELRLFCTNPSIVITEAFKAFSVTMETPAEYGWLLYN